jgi:S-adenosylmethionine:tRNA ribosyltransferase-isomerase
MTLSDFDYHLPQNLIAQTPVNPRDHSRLMVLDRRSQKITHDYFYNLLKYLRVDDLLVFNQTKVIPARLFGNKETGGKVEILLLPNQGHFNFIARNLGRAKKILFDNGLMGEVSESTIKFNCSYAEVLAKLSEIGHTPLLPYIHPGEGLTEPKLRQMCV